MSERTERVVPLVYSCIAVVVMVAALMLSFGPYLSAALLAVVAADQARVISTVAGWSLAVSMGTSGLLLLRRFGSPMSPGGAITRAPDLASAVTAAGLRAGCGTPPANTARYPRRHTVDDGMPGKT
ncbi:hypothetical protein AB0I53_09995 [Saccharopolyspora sp. NPDC050389]|uniref:hypothetical protein n=1 Tax=Saccharopolyspora sp. NPDC050389 TaxID=3155516 RepID=UPI0033DF61C4